MTSVGTVISYPIPLYQNLPIEITFYKPRRFVISNIILGETTSVITTQDNDFVIGQEVRLLIPPSFGTIELNNKIAYVISRISENEVELDIFTLGGNAFILSPNLTCVAQILSIGDINSGIINKQGISKQKIFIPGSFRNISPNTRNDM